MFKFMLIILGAIAEIKRELTLERIREDMAKSKRCGIRFGKPVGRPPWGISASFKKDYPMWKDRDIATTDFARLIGVSRSTLYKYIEGHKGYINSDLPSEIKLKLSSNSKCL